MATHKCNKEKEIGEIRTNMAVVSQKVISIEKKLFGNGTKGLISRMDEVIEWIQFKKGSESGIERWSRRKIAITAGVLIPIMLLIMQLVVEYIRNKLGG